MQDNKEKEREPLGLGEIPQSKTTAEIELEAEKFLADMLEKNEQAKAEKAAKAGLSTGIQALIEKQDRMEEELSRARQENEEMREKFIRARAQGKAIIRQNENTQNDRLAEIYKGTEIEHLFRKKQ